ncbi:hypothetical protein BD410DRAFT_812553 [Rickenella mellea]|uniref:PhoD-like phosphatase domain-containing protein n=1 Tax=Rickenella mellea TaxID=50990 RepID=A0A4Y7QJJ5_9AGAM|nr:hypothetical protein BD410DRAFT_812553 [Rickenella mellea]
MDNPGWHAIRRAQRESTQDPPIRGPDGHFKAVEQLSPMNEGFTYPPSIPRKNDAHTPDAGHQYNNSWSPEDAPRVIPGPGRSHISRMTAVERSQNLRIARTTPHLQFMVGPLLRYDTVDKAGIWNGFCLIVTADAGSIYEPHPNLVYEWDPEMPTSMSRTASNRSGATFSLGPHPADPYNFTPDLEGREANGHSSSYRMEQTPGHEIWMYEGNGGTFTFWRFTIQIPLSANEMVVKYSINHCQALEFFVPGRNQNMRWAAYSCNGFSSGVNPDDFRGPGFKTGYDPVWTDLLEKHAEHPFHILVGGGDQLYCDGVTREPELQEWMTLSKPDLRRAYQLTEEVELAIDRFYFNHYCQVFRSGAFSRANSTIPMVNMAGNIDGFGSYPDDWQNSPVFKAIGSRGYFFYLLFQCFINVGVDGLDDRPGKHSNKSIIIGGDGPFIPFPSHSFLTYLGPQCSMLLLDCRAERKKDQVCSRTEYDKVMEQIYRLPKSVEHLIVQIGIPIAYPRMVFLEKALGSKYNPFVTLGKKGSLGMSGLVNKFNADAELLDDLNDHWTAKGHKAERNWFIQQLQQFALLKRIRITFLSGDVHCAAVGCLKTHVKEKSNKGATPATDHRYMLNIVSSAIVNTPPPAAVLTLVSSLSTKVHKTLHHADTDETMIPLFTTEPNGAPSKSKFIMGRRNWCSVSWDRETGELRFDIRVEKEKGIGSTVGYEVRTPPPQWSPP